MTKQKEKHIIEILDKRIIKGRVKYKVAYEGTDRTSWLFEESIKDENGMLLVISFNERFEGLDDEKKPKDSLVIQENLDKLTQSDCSFDDDDNLLCQKRSREEEDTDFTQPDQLKEVTNKSGNEIPNLINLKSKNKENCEPDENNYKTEVIINENYYDSIRYPSINSKNSEINTRKTLALGSENFSRKENMKPELGKNLDPKVTRFHNFVNISEVTVIKIKTIRKYDGVLYALVKYLNNKSIDKNEVRSEEEGMISTKDLVLKYPLMMLDYYENRIDFTRKTKQKTN